MSFWQFLAAASAGAFVGLVIIIVVANRLFARVDRDLNPLFFKLGENIGGLEVLNLRLNALKLELARLEENPGAVTPEEKQSVENQRAEVMRRVAAREKNLEEINAAIRLYLSQRPWLRFLIGTYPLITNSELLPLPALGGSNAPE